MFNIQKTIHTIVRSFTDLHPVHQLRPRRFVSSQPFYSFDLQQTLDAPFNSSYIAMNEYRFDFSSPLINPDTILWLGEEIMEWDTGETVEWI